MKEYITPIPGDIVTVDGKKIGKHDGLLFYTIGQKIHLPNQLVRLMIMKENWLYRYYVCKKKNQSNELIVCEKDHPALYSTQVIVR